jgi:FHA domain
MEGKERDGDEAARRPDSATSLRAPRFALEYGAQRLPLRDGETIVGRAPECEVTIDSHLVSRRHARFTVSDRAVFIEDLGSVNGVRVDGVAIRAKTLIAPGARVSVADSILTLVRHAEQSARVTARVQTQDSMLAAGRSTEPNVEITRRAHAFKLIAGVVDKALALGKPEEAERLLGGLLQEVLSEAQSHRRVPDEIAQAAAKSALKLAGANGKGQWLDYPARLYLALGRILPLALVDELYTVSRRGRLDVALLGRYAEKLAAMRLGPSDRFTLQRIRNLAQMAANR